MILVDTTIWIDFFSGKESREVEILAASIQQQNDLCICGVILTEILQGIRQKKQYLQILDLFNSLQYLEMNQEVYVLAADIYRSLRIRGITVRKSIDCMIAATAIHHKIPLLHNDRDFTPIQKYCGLKVI